MKYHINLNDVQSSVVQQVKDACLDQGFFYLEFDRIIDPQLVAAAFAVSKEFFALDTATKSLYNHQGYSAYQAETLNTQQQTEGDTKEGFSIKSNESIDSDPKLNLPNRWSTTTSLDVNLIMQEYLSKLTSIGMRLAEILALALGLHKNVFDSYLQKPRRYIRMLKYSEKKSNPTSGVYAAGAHSDYGFITLLVTDDQPGLEILDKDGVWQPIPAKDGCFIVNIGDMLERLSNGIFLSPKHRVINNTGKSRYSIPFFFNVNENVAIEPQLANPNRKRSYPRTTFLEYLAEKTKQTYNGETPNLLGYSAEGF